MLHSWHTISLKDDPCYAGGPLEFIFVVDSIKDSAVPVVQQLIEEHNELNSQQQQQPHGSSSPTNDAALPDTDDDSAGISRVARLVVAGQTSSCSQKIHNLVAGLSSATAAHGYLLFCDDDVQLHPQSIAHLVDALEADATAFMATGFPFDIPPPRASLLSYAVLVYHLPLLIGFSASHATSFVWGGCMMMRMTAMKEDTAGLVKAWCDGGYSDDLLIGGLCSEQNLKILSPPSALFPQRLPPRYNLRQYWNYLRRQLFVLDTYHNEHNRRLNLTLMIMHAWMSGAFAFSCLAAAGQLQLAAAQLLSGSVQLLRRSSVHATADSCSSFIGGTSMSWVFVASCCCAQVCLWWMTKQVLLLFDQLSNGQTSGGSGQHAGGFRSLQEGDASGRLHPKQDAVATHISSSEHDVGHLLRPTLPPNPMYAPNPVTHATIICMDQMYASLTGGHHFNEPTTVRWQLRVLSTKSFGNCQP
eukprot:jgi/Chrzof1/6345/Cz18g05040.t1